MVELSIKIVITGDSHLNYYNQRLGSRLTERRAQIGKTWRETIDFAIEKKVDLYLSVGDLFDQVLPRNPPRARVVEAFAQLKDAGVKAFVIAGTHDSPATMIDGASPHSLLQEAGLATVFEDPLRFGQEILNIRGTTVSIAGISTDRRLSSGMDPIENVTIPAGADFNIAMLHYSIEKIASPQWEEPTIQLASLEKNRQINLFAMGHIHKHVTRRLGDSLILYPGATERFDFGEAENETGFCYVNVEAKKTRVEYIRTQSQPMKQLRLHSSELPAEDPTEAILKAIVEASNPVGLLQLVLEGNMRFEDYLKMDFLRLFDEGRRRNFYYEYMDNIRPIVEGIEYQASLGLHPRDELVSMASQIIERTDPKDRELWKRALELATSYYDRYVEM